MAQKPITFKQLGISLDDIVVHLQDKAIVKTKIVEKQIIKEVDPDVIKKLVANQIALLPTPAPTIDEKIVNKLIANQIASQELTKPEVTRQSVKKLIANQIVSLPAPTIDEKIVNKLIANQIASQELTKPEVTRQSVKKLIANQIALLPTPAPTIDEKTVNKLIANQIASQELTKLEVTRQSVKKLIANQIASQELTKLEVTKQFVKKLIANQIENQPIQTPINHIVEKIDIPAVKHLVSIEVQKHLSDSLSTRLDNQAIVELVTEEVQKHLPKPPKVFEPIPANLDEHKLWATQEIDGASSIVRSKFITVAPGQESLYAEKVDEATDYIADGATDLSMFPLLRAEVNGTGKTTDEVVDGILSSKSQWIAVNAQIEEIRLRAKTTINSVDVISDEEVDNIKNQAITLLQAL
jgi:hypothetical protein